MEALEHYRALRRQALTDAFLARQRSAAVTQIQRSRPRARVVLPLTLHLGEWETDTQTLDLSEGGFAFIAGQIPSFSEFRFSLELMRGVVMRGDVRIVDTTALGDKHRICVQFLRLSEEQRSVVEAVVLQALLAADAMA